MAMEQCLAVSCLDHCDICGLAIFHPRYTCLGIGQHITVENRGITREHCLIREASDHWLIYCCTAEKEANIRTWKHTINSQLYTNIIATPPPSQLHDLNKHHFDWRSEGYGTSAGACSKLEREQWEKWTWLHGTCSELQGTVYFVLVSSTGKTAPRSQFFYDKNPYLKSCDIILSGK